MSSLLHGHAFPSPSRNTRTSTDPRHMHMMQRVLQCLKEEGIILEYHRASNRLRIWYWPLDDGGHLVHPSELSAHKTVFDFRAPGCLCASSSSDRDAFTETHISKSVLADTSITIWIASCATNNCPYSDHFAELDIVPLGQAFVAPNLPAIGYPMRQIRVQGFYTDSTHSTTKQGLVPTRSMTARERVLARTSTLLEKLDKDKNPGITETENVDAYSKPRRLDFRCVRSIKEDGAPIIFFRQEEAVETTQWHTLYNRLFTPLEHHYTIGSIAAVLRPLLSQEVVHREREELVQLVWPLGERVNCAAGATFVTLAATSSLIRSVIGSALVFEGPGASRTIYTRPVDSFLYNDFMKRFSRGEPVVVTDVNLRGPWKPQSFINLYGKQVVTLVDTETEEEIKQDLAQFFGAFGTFDPQRRSLKLKDWPPTENFKDRFWDHFESFRLAVPFPDLTRPDGIFNLAANFPENVLSPDLGPKMYNAYGTLDDDAHHGSTRLHMDVTDAVNILAHAATPPDGAPGGARWTIFHRSDAAALSKFLRESRTPKYDDVGDPIHSQAIYLTSRDLQLLEEEHHIVPYVFTQTQGDAVSNYTDSIKVACDFVSIENLPTTLQVAQEYRQERLVKEGDDVLQIYKTLWDAWNCLNNNRDDLVTTEDDTAMSGSPDRTEDPLNLQSTPVCGSPSQHMTPHSPPPDDKRVRSNRIKRRAARKKRTLKKDPSTIFVCPVFSAGGACWPMGGPYDQNGMVCHLGDLHKDTLHLSRDRKLALRRADLSNFRAELDRLRVDLSIRFASTATPQDVQ
ncbi:hypothetical protein DENSPDRAFT_855380 [Dentipellis sp. KUC8613]|nr:hypothetical protein DENSPDRAFT_855380 [Dentipellis sp. KUC8613]